MEKQIICSEIYRSPITTQSSYTLQTLLSFFFLIGFLAIVGWFNIVDVYHTHFFEHSIIVFIYNLFRIIFMFYVTWILYFSGYLLLSASTPHWIPQRFTFSERIILSFGTGIGFWHLLMLILGIANLYYSSLLAVLCFLVLTASLSHFHQVMHKIVSSFRSQKKFFGQKITFPVIISLLLGCTLFWLLLVRGLYPGGGGDYFTHYFYYYLNVIQHHGLTPNDVWYHYYYSKGAGLHFLGMLLTDPEAPQMVTFCCVCIAALSLANLTYRFAPHSLWPAFCAILYVVYNLIEITGNSGGEFQKTHEETSAIVVIMTWTICMYHLRPLRWEKPAFIALTALLIGAAIVTQAIVVFFILFFILQAARALIKKNWRTMWFYCFLISIGICAVSSILLLNYLVTGLATDQSLHLTWRFANLERLNKWGVIPNIMLVAWIRDNYDLVATPFGWKTVQQLLLFLRADALKILIICTIATFVFSTTLFIKNKKIKSRLIKTIVNVSLLIMSFAILAIFIGHSQATSFFRFSSFFFPLLTLLCTLCWSYIAAKTQWQLAKVFIPAILFIAVLHSWHHWFHNVSITTRDARRFMTGRYSLNDAYVNQHSGLYYGGISPGALTAVRQIPPGKRIWSTNVDSYCMAPNCQIESVISFKLSAKMNNILNGTPEEAKKILQQEGLNYFLFTANVRLLDIMPYSQLFHPDTIKKYIAIKWTDGNTYLLTWPGPDTRPIDEAFLKAYIHRLNAPEDPWFRFSKAVPQLNETMKMLLQSPHPWQPIIFPWQKKIPPHAH